MKKLKYFILPFVFMLCMITNAKAANFGYESSYFAIQGISNCNVSLSNCISVNYWSDFVEIGDTLIVPIGMPGGIYRLNVRAYSTSSNLFRQDTYYTFSYRINQKYISPYALSNVYVSDAYASSVQSLDNATRLDTSKIGLTITKESDNYYYLNLSVSPTTNYRVFEFIIAFGNLESGEGLNFNPDNATNTISLTTLSITYEADNSGAINNQTNVITNQTNSIINQQGQTNQKLDNLNDNLTNSNSDDATNSASEFFSGFETDTFGLTSIITAPLNLIGSITSSSCSPLGLPLPYVDKNLTLPCLTSIYKQHFGAFLDIYQIITFGITAYWVLVRIFALVKDFKNPDHDEIEVLDL